VRERRIAPSNYWPSRGVRSARSPFLVALAIVLFAFVPATPAAAVAPSAITGFVAPRLDTSARLNASVDPNGEATSVHFEYGTAGPCSANPCQSTPTEAVGAASYAVGELPPVVSAGLSGLSPATTYDYRIVATNSTGTTFGEDREFTTRSVAEVTPPSRGIELVNSPDKGNQNVVFDPPLMSRTQPMSTDGNRVIWRIFGGAPGGTSGTVGSFLAERTPNGWESRSLVPPAAEQFDGGEAKYVLTSTTPDLSQVFFQAAKSDGPFTFGESAMIRVDAAGHQQILRHYPSTVEEAFPWTTDDGTHAISFSNETRQLEDIGSGTPEIVSVLPDGSTSECEPRGGFSFSPGYHAGYEHMSTTDGSRVYFLAGVPGECAKQGLYERKRDSETTVAIGSGSSEEEFIRSSKDGHRAIFVTGNQLAPDDENTEADIYEWNDETEDASCLTCVGSATGPHIAQLTSFYSTYPILVSSDLSRVYFFSTASLVPGAPSGTGLYDAGGLYVIENGELHFAAPFSTIEIGPQLIDTTSLSNDGQTFVMVAEPKPGLTADATQAQCIDPHTGELGPCEELYRYDDRDGGVECLSCRPNGTTKYSIGFSGRVTFSKRGQVQMSADGSTISFVTMESLVPADVNHDADAYEWHNGKLSLVTDGISDFVEGDGSPHVWGIDANGDTILFSVAEPGLTGFEQDGLANAYAARVGGGFEPPTPGSHCNEDDCQGPLGPPPPQSTPASAGITGTGNVGKGTIKRQGRCASRQGKARRRCVKHRRKHKKREQPGRVHSLPSIGREQ
jgi:hypothetical protein